MYDRRLDAILAAAQLGSFGKAAERLHISTPALAKQVNTFEREHHLILFNRSRSGVNLTKAGSLLVDDARAIIRQSDDALRRARAAMTHNASDEPVRLGVSVLRSARMVLDLWQRSGKRHSGIRLELVPLPDDFATFEHTARHLGDTVDVVACSFIPSWWEGSCNMLTLCQQPECLAVPRTDPLASKAMLELDDLEGRRIHVIRHNRGGLDAVRDLLESHPAISIVDIDYYELSTFNDCAESGDLLVSKPIWDDVHPGLVNIPVNWPFSMPYGLLYPLTPSPSVQRFINELGQLNRKANTVANTMARQDQQQRTISDRLLQ